jgi:ABC-2 type transport system ATP-binding protein
MRNGAGKTTTLRMLLGLIRPGVGAATIAGKPYPELARVACSARPGQ